MNSPEAPIIKNENEYKFACNRLSELIDIVGENEEHPFVTEMLYLADIIENYEKYQGWR